MRTVLLAMAVLLALLVAVGVVVWRGMRPPPPLAVPERGATLANVTVVVPGLYRASGQTVVVRGDRIATIRPASAAEQREDGGFLLPGLVDLHVHFPPAGPLGDTEHFALLFLRHGVTTVRDAGDVQGTATTPAREGVAAGRFPGPRVFACGPFVDGPAARWPNSRVVRDAASAEAAVAEIAAAGLDCVKAYDDLAPEALAAVRDAAARHGLPVIGHVPRATRFEDARLGDVQHLTGIAGYPDGPPFPDAMAAWPDLPEARLAAVVEAAVREGIAVTPTLVATDRMAHLDRPETLRAEPDAALVPRYWRDVVWQPAPDWDAADFRALREAQPFTMRLLRRLHEAGAEVHVGSDTLVPFVVPGAGLHREMRLFEQAGFAPETAWALATWGNGDALGVPGLGRVETGAPADLLRFRDDPTSDLDALSTLEAVVADGRLYARQALDDQVARARAWHESLVFDRVSVLAARFMLARLERGQPQETP